MSQIFYARFFSEIFGWFYIKKLFEGVLLKGNRPEVEPGIFMANEAPNDHFDSQITV